MAPPSPPISVEAVTLARLFSRQYIFNLPWYQRAYAWTTEHAICLLQDIREALDNDEWYHLGDFTLAKRTDDPKSAIVDGQQRIVTLTIIFAVLRDRSKDSALQAELDERIWAEVAADAEPTPRLSPKNTIEDVLRNYVQENGATLNDPGPEAAREFNESQARVIANRNALRKEVKDLSDDDVGVIARFLIDRCYGVVGALSDWETAKKIFAKTQTRGLSLTPFDINKVNILNHVKPDAREECVKIWEDWAARLDESGLEDLLFHMRDIKVRKRTNKTLETELFDNFDIEEDAEGFIKNELAPMAELLFRIKTHDLGEGEAFDAVNRRLQYLNWVRHKTWAGPVLYWLSRHGDELDKAQEPGDLDETLKFLIALERFAYIHMIRHSETRKRDSTYYQIIKAIKTKSVFDDNSPIGVSAKDVQAAVVEMEAQNFLKKSYRTEVLLRTNATFEEDPDSRARPAPFETLEHCLPLRPNKKSRWEKSFPDKVAVTGSVHRLGNGTLLTVKENGAAGNKDFHKKFNGYEGSKFAMSRALGKQMDALADQKKDWDGAQIKNRTQRLIDKLLAAWGLKRKK